jgi:hypothetical protein
MKIPKNVHRFELLMYATIPITLALEPYYSRFRSPSPFDRFTALIILMVAVSVYVVVIWAIARKRQNWLRLGMVAIFVISLPGNGIAIWHESFNSYLDSFLLAANLLIGIIAYYFIFTGDAIPWFETRAKTADFG